MHLSGGRNGTFKYSRTTSVQAKIRHDEYFSARVRYQTPKTRDYHRSIACWGRAFRNTKWLDSNPRS